ncbi:hypothetical protein PAXRUDRAFT_175380, partial [Paxillus rubicundulus Ve08.2h10]
FFDASSCVLAFTIPCFILQRNRTNSPFEITSDISYNTLRIVIANKLGSTEPGLLQLQYWLDPKSKQAATSVQSVEELNLFKARLRPMLVPPFLPSGKPSTRQLKNVSVYFEDKWIVNEFADPSNGKPSGKGNRMGAKTTGSGLQCEQTSAAAMNKLIKELQERWTCNVHAHGDNPVYCYSPSDNSAMCYQLTIMRLGMWAMEIVCYKLLVAAPTLTDRGFS